MKMTSTEIMNSVNEMVFIVNARVITFYPLCKYMLIVNSNDIRTVSLSVVLTL